MNDLVSAPYIEQLYVKGTFNGWGDDSPMSFVGEGRYQAVICLSADQHSFKISDQQGSEALTLSADKQKSTVCYLDNNQALVPAKGIGNDLLFTAPETGLYTISLLIQGSSADDASTLSHQLIITAGGEDLGAELNRELISAQFNKIPAVSKPLNAKPAPVLSPNALFEQLAIRVEDSASFAFGDNVDGFYEGTTQRFVVAGKYRHKQGWYLGSFGSFVNNVINDKAAAPIADIYPYGVTHHYDNQSSDTLMLLSQQRGAALSVRSAKPSMLMIAPQLNLAINASTVTEFAQGVVYALDPALRQDNTPSYIAISANKPFSFKETVFADHPALNEHMHLNSNHVKPVIETVHAETDFTVYLAFAESEQAAIDQATSLLEKDGYTSHIQQTYDMLTNSYLWTSDIEYNRALMWAKASGKVFVSNEFGKGIWAGLPWFKDCWGRDSFIALPGITLVNGDFSDAKAIIDNFASMQLTDVSSMNYGRIPNRVTSLSNIIYNTTDGTPWMVRELWDYLRYSGDEAYAQAVYPVVQTYIDGIEKNYLDEFGFMTHRDPDTWMDAKLEGKLPWSSRGNRANDIQVLWFTSLMVAVELAKLNDDEASATHYLMMADKVQASFQSMFWDQDKGLLADRLKSDNSGDFQIRPNQLMTISVPFDKPLVDDSIGAQIVKNAVSELLFPWGITSLSQHDAMFHPYHDNRDEYHKDAAYHNGTVWGWNSGFTVSSLIRYGYADFAYELSKNLAEQVLYIGHRGAMSENLDAFTNKEGEITTTGTYAQAWSVSEFTRNGYQDYLGFLPELMRNAITFSPCLPAQWQMFDADVAFGQSNGLKVTFCRPENAIQRYQLCYRESTTVVLELTLTAADHAKYQVVLPMSEGGAVVEFNTQTAVVSLNGIEVAAKRVQESYTDKIGVLAFSKPDLSLEFPMLQGQHVLQQQVEACNYVSVVD
ncbi:amylo-alpha-1,6-glucosidase [Moritella yayanosii]|uniref:Glycogen debranching protein n=1 Tax=Moritella yayanosii TaxID=69539 RepID=A0A330LQW1_9GAMM|nr:amylo-alpha-1,6-glucosidase [Moritella yayanosii]SQD78248.1 Glycogen debranching protein [Moritella yayanosii]